MSSTQNFALAEKDNVLVYRVNIDENSDLASQFQVRSIPTWFMFKALRNC
ncbi:thioredoxin family protein [Mycoplasmopsis bovis]